jgi:hypothetical protein
VEFAEVVEFLAFANIFDGLAGDLPHREGGTTTGIAIEFGQDDAADSDGVVEVLRDGNGLLTGGGVGDEEGLLRFDEFVELLELLDEGAVDFLAARGVENDDGGVARFLGFESLFGDLEEVFSPGSGVKTGTSAISPILASCSMAAGR